MLPKAGETWVGAAWHFCGVEQKGLSVEEISVRRERATGEY